MAILNYTDIFTNVGSLIAASNGYDSIGTVILPENRQAILDSFQAQSQNTAISGAVQTFDGMIGNVSDWKNGLIQYMTNRLTDPDTVVRPLRLATTDLDVVIPAIIVAMGDDSASVQQSVVTVGSVVANAFNLGDGTVCVSKVLDGYSSPGLNMPANYRYAGLDSELTVPDETLTFQCIQDSGTNGLTPGDEVFSVNGALRPNSFTGVATQGSGQGPTVNTCQQDDVLQNGDFESWDSNTPDSWTIGDGTAGVNVFDDTVAANVYTGDHSLKMLGDGTTATISINQAFIGNTVFPLRRYHVSGRFKFSAAGGAAGTFTVTLQGTGYSPAASEKIQYTAGTLPTSWVLGFYFVNLPAQLPEDLAVVIRWTGTPTNGLYASVDDVHVAPVDWWGGVGFKVVPGNVAFVNNDAFYCHLENDTDGVFQNAFRCNYGVQLPSSASPTIPDSLAE